METQVPFLLTVEWEGGPELKAVAARLQFLARKFGFKPTWLVAMPPDQPDSLEPLRRWQQEDDAEVGAWFRLSSIPPFVDMEPLSDRRSPVLTDFPETVLEEKMRHLTESLERVFGRKPTTARVTPASVDDRYYAILARLGYRVDLTVTPHAKIGPSDFTGYSEKPYLTPQGILEIPRTVRRWRHNDFIEDLSKLPSPWGPMVRVVFPPLRCLNLRRGNLLTVDRLLSESERHRPEHLDLRITLRSDGRAEATLRALERTLASIQTWTLGQTAEEFLKRFRTAQLRKDLV